MNALLVAAVMIVAPTAGKPVGIKRAIKTANRITASATATWTRFDPGSDEYKSAIETVELSGAFDRPVKVSVSNVAVQVDPQTGAITLRGTYKGINQDIRKFYTLAEGTHIQDFDRETKAINAKFKRDIHRYYETHEHSKRSNVDHWVAHQEDEHNARMKKRANQRQRFVTDLGAYAKERKKTLEGVHIETVIPPALASTIDMKKLTTKKKVLLTIQVRLFGFREASEEIDYPVSVGNLSGETIAITKSFLKKTP